MLKALQSEIQPLPAKSQDIPWPRKVDLFGTSVSVTDYDKAVAVICQAARQRVPAVVSCHAVHAIVTTSTDPVLCGQVRTFQMITPDGQPVRYALNLLYGVGLSDRVYGPELMGRLCCRAAEEGIPIYLYGGSPVTVERLHANLRKAHRGLQIVGWESPPFTELTPQEDQAVVERINASGAGLVFIGLGCPKQDRFAYAHRSHIRAVQCCVGAAFDFHAGMKRMAPAWMQRYGLEWLYRLAQEPRRLWRRYLVTNSIFLGALALALFRRRCWRRQDTPLATAAATTQPESCGECRHGKPHYDDPCISQDRP